MTRVTAGRLTSLWVVLQTLSKLGGEAPVRETISLAERSGLRSGGLPIDDGLALAIEGGFVKILDDRVALGTLGKDALVLGTEAEPPPRVLRLFISVLLLRDPPHWIAYWQGDPASIENLLSGYDRQLLSAAGMLPSESSFLARAWWRALSQVPLSEHASRLRELIGAAGEELSVIHEKSRLEGEGFRDLAREVVWVARESPAYGFDVASFVGGSIPGANPEDALAIEVKSVAFPVAAKFPLHLTIHEWETAKDLRASYVFHLWDGVSPRPNLRARNPSPLVMPPERLAGHLALEPQCSGSCRWETCYLEVPLTELISG